MEELRNESEQEILQNETPSNMEVRKNLDDFFSSFEESIAKPTLFAPPAEGETCEFCSA